MKYFELPELNTRFYLGEISKEVAIKWILSHHPFIRSYVEANLIEVQS